MLHVNAYLVRTTGFEYAFNQCYIVKPLNNLIMRNSMLAMITFRIGIKHFPKPLMTPYMGLNAASLFLYVPQTNAMYCLVTVWLKNCFARLAADSAVLATTSRPVVFYRSGEPIRNEVICLHQYSGFAAANDKQCHSVKCRCNYPRPDEQPYLMVC